MTSSCRNNSKTDRSYIGTCLYSFLKCSQKTCAFSSLLLHLVLSSFQIIVSIGFSSLFSSFLSTLKVSQHSFVSFREEALSFSLLQVFKILFLFSFCVISRMIFFGLETFKDKVEFVFFIKDLSLRSSSFNYPGCKCFLFDIVSCTASSIVYANL